MKLFLDTANLDEIRTARRWGILAGVTTNPSLIAAEGADFERRIVEICEIVDGPVSAEIIETDVEAAIRQGERLAGLHPHVVVKVPTTPDGLTVCHELAQRGIRVNMTLIFSLNQALVAARAGAAYVSPFAGRLDDVGHDGMAVVRDIVECFARYGLPTEVIAASIRHPVHVMEAARCGAHIATMPFRVMRQLVQHPLTDIGLERFLDDWRKRFGDPK